MTELVAAMFAGCATAPRGQRAPWRGVLLCIAVALASPVVAGEPANPRAVAPPDIRGRIVVGYQGWYAADGDGAGIGFFHYRGKWGFWPGQCCIDYWPDVSECGEDEKRQTMFKHRDGTAAHVYSAFNQATVARHLAWMREFDIGGAFLQRFAVDTKNDKVRAFRDKVLENVRGGSNRHGVPWALMYDLTGLAAGEIEGVLVPDLRRLLERHDFRHDRYYLHFKGRPLIGIWGVGFNDGRQYSLAEIDRLVERLHGRPAAGPLKRGLRTGDDTASDDSNRAADGAPDAELGGWAVFLGVPYWWRELHRDAVGDPALHTLIAKADIVSPWSVGRYDTPANARLSMAWHVTTDRKWLGDKGVAYCPVVFPGFSWHNLHARAADKPLDQIPRRGGDFYTAQLDSAIAGNAGMIYVAMFDEMDEGTCIFNVSQDPPVGTSPFLTYDGRPADHYLKLTRDAARKLIDNTAQPHSDLPARNGP